ncbi:IS21 family transposase [Fibrobacterota bacterium]
MSRRRKKMREIRSILYYRLGKGISAERTSRALKISKGTVINTVKRFKESGLSWPLSEDLNDSSLEHALYPPSSPKRDNTELQLPSVAYLEQELAKKHVTLQCLYDEYRQGSPDAVSRSSFYRYYRKNRPQSCSMPMEYKGGDLLFIDYSGDGLEYVDRETGEIISVELFCCCWGASNYSYAEVTHSQKKEDFVYSHPRAFRYFGVVPHGLVPDNLKSGVKQADRYDPILNPLYEEMARHYNTAGLPARVRKPKDKAKIENGVLHIQRFILARLRNRHFFSLHEINNAVWELLEEFNKRPMKDYGNQTRRERFARLDKPYAQQLPPEPFRVTEVKLDVLVGKNYHVRYKDHFYSVPFEYVGKRVKIRRCGGMVEINYQNQCLSRHLFSTRKYGYTTKSEHMPKAHQFVKGLTPGWIISQASEIGPKTVEVISTIMRRSEHIQQGFNAALGVLRLAKAYTKERLEAACERCVFYHTENYRSLKSVLQNNLDKQPIRKKSKEDSVEQLNVFTHENVRGNYE